MNSVTKKERVLRWGVMSTANIAIDHLIPALQRSERNTVHAIASRDELKAKQVADRFDIGHYVDRYESLLRDPTIDAIYIPLPNHLHEKWAIQAAQAGKHVLCEKPMAMSARSAERIIHACLQNNVYVQEAFMYRHHPRYERVKQLLQDGEIGPIRSIHSWFTFNISHLKGNIRFQKQTGGGALFDCGCYALHATRFLLDQEPVAVTMTSYYSDAHDGVDMMNSALVEYPGGVGATVQFGMHAANRNAVEIIGASGSITVPFAFYHTDESLQLDIQTDNGFRQEGIRSVDHYENQVDDFAAAVLDNRPLIHPDDALANARLLEASQRSAIEQRRVELNEIYRLK